MNKGLSLEKSLSKQFHQKGLPLLVSGKLLRSRQLGQIDLARITRDKEGWLIEVAEVKSSQIGLESMERMQRKRLAHAQSFLAAIFGHRTKFMRVTKAVGILLVLQKFPTFINLLT